MSKFLTRSAFGGGRLIALANLTLSVSNGAQGAVFAATVGGLTPYSTLYVHSSDGTAFTINGSTITGTFSGSGVVFLTLTERIGSFQNRTKFAISVTPGQLLLGYDGQPLLGYDGQALLGVAF